MAKEVWRLLNIEKERAELAVMQNARQAMDYILKAQEDKKPKMVILLWTIWNERNLVREEGRRWSGMYLARSIDSYVTETSKFSLKNDKTVMRNLAKWSIPPTGSLKLNCDASFIQSSRNGSWGFIIRDEDGDVVMSGRGKIDYVLSVFHAELIACLQGVQAAINLGIGHIILECDAREVIHAINSDAYSYSALGYLIEEVKSLLALNFISFVCAFKERECNRPAHELAALGFMCVEGEEQIMSSVPDNVAVLVANFLLSVD